MVRRHDHRPAANDQPLPRITLCLRLQRGCRVQGWGRTCWGQSLGKGWVGNEALAIALLCALTAETRTPAGIADGLWHAVLHSGDSDSTGSITGNLLGAMVGVKGLPPRWLSQVELRPVIERLEKDLYAVSVKKAQLNYMEYPPS